MKYKTIDELAAAAKSGEFTGIVTVDNDAVYAYQGDEEVFNFDGDGPESALIATLGALGIRAESP